MNTIVKLLMAVIIIAASGTLSSCKKNFDNPPGPADPAIVANTSIKALKAMHTSNGAYDIITTDLIISGVVVADDKSGNFYKQLFIQDATGGLQILLDANSLYGTYPVGRRIFIRCKDLCISDYNGTMELGVKALVSGLPSLEGIPANLINKYVTGGSLNNPVVPIVVNYSQLTTNMQDQYLGSLIQLDGYEFADTTVTYSDTSVYKSTTNQFIRTCGGPLVTVRTSAYADFAGQRVASGYGSIVAIYTTFGTTRQLILRNTDDIKFTGLRCNIFEEDFNKIGANNNTLDAPGWYNVGEVGGKLFQNAIFGSTKCAKASAFSTGIANMTSWLITPAISLAGPTVTAPKLTFQNGAFQPLGTTTLRVYVSTNYNGGNTPSTATWTQLPANIATTSTFISSGSLSLTPYIGQTVYIGFRYDGGDPGRTTTFEIDDVAVSRR
jgi:hypothetical protein